MRWGGREGSAGDFGDLNWYPFWYPLQPNPVVAESLLDRLINSSHQLFSYRLNKRPGAKDDRKKQRTALGWIGYIRNLLLERVGPGDGLLPTLRSPAMAMPMARRTAA